MSYLRSSTGRRSSLLHVQHSSSPERHMKLQMVLAVQVFVFAFPIGRRCLLPFRFLHWLCGISTRTYYEYKYLVVSYNLVNCLVRSYSLVVVLTDFRPPGKMFFACVAFWLCVAFFQVCIMHAGSQTKCGTRLRVTLDYVNTSTVSCRFYCKK